MEIQLEHLYKRIKTKVIYEDINMKLSSGKVYGLVGVNGSGKTMLLRTLSGLVIPSSGLIYVDGKTNKSMDMRHVRVGLVIENTTLYTDMSGYENLRYLGNINGTVTDAQIRNALEKIGLNPKDPQKVSKYSLGMRQKLALAQAFLGEPQLLLLDEPTNALDEKAVECVRDMILEAKKRGCIVVLASHNREDIEMLCDEVYELENGTAKLFCAENRR